MSVAVKIGIIGFGLLVATAAYEAYTRGDPPEVVSAQAAVARELAQKLVASLPPEARWSRVSVEQARSSEYLLTVHYLPDKATAPEIEADARAVAQGMLLQLSMAGRHPSDEQTVITVTARQGDDGAVLGVAHFDPGKDRIVYQAVAR